MPNTQSAKKRMRQNAKRRARNRAAKSAMKTAIKRTKAEPTDDALAREALRTIGKTSKRGIIHANKAARLASRLQRRINASKSESAAG
jgi:small subunit ribosomal protein S20